MYHYVFPLMIFCNPDNLYDYDFILASLANEILEKGLFKKERLCSSGSKFLPVRVDPI